jgi:dihydropteroate synthase
VALGYPILLGASRKRFIAALDPLGRRGDSSAWADRWRRTWHGAAAGVAAVRVHDVREAAQALAVWEAIGGA